MKSPFLLGETMTPGASKAHELRRLHLAPEDLRERLVGDHGRHRAEPPWDDDMTSIPSGELT